MRKTVKSTSNNENVLCRLCGCSEEEHFINLFASTVNEAPLHGDILEKIETYLKLTITKLDGLPHSVCSACVSTLNSFHKFFVCCQEINQNFNEIHTERDVEKPPKQLPSNESNLTNHQNKTDFTSSTLIQESTTEKETANHVDQNNCPDISDLSPQKNDEQNELKTKDDEQQSECEYCVQKFDDQDNLNEHLRDLHSELIFHCDVCGRYIARTNLISHMTEHALQLCSQPNETETLAENTTATATEPIEDEQIEPAKTNDLQCSYCSKIFASPASKKTHINAIHKDIRNFKCSICEATFSTKRILQNHLNCIHVKEKPYKCSECPKAFSADAGLHSHKKCHETNYPYACDVCDKKFKFRPHLARHKTMHTKEKSYFCKFCSKGFGVKHNLTKHMRTHLDVSDFKCHICSFTTTQKRYLAEHMKHVHQTVLAS